jgi:hypothetical protein
MSAATQPREAAKKEGKLQIYLLDAGSKIYKGTFVFVRANGYAWPGRSTTSITDVFVGIAYETVDNTSGAAGAASIRVEREGSYVFGLASAVQANIGAPVYATDDQTLTLTSGSTVVKVGNITEIINANNVRISIDTARQ